ncbi:MAG: class I SAM-dependent methyltransferase [Nitrospinae bacterium]|nr:class I SAM-dependent methyltransferase [Nitrospinota bacterium]
MNASLKMEKFYQIASFIDPGSYVFDVGCGEGQLASILTKKGCQVDGMDINLDRLMGSRDHYKNVIEGDIETFDFDRHAQKYDVVVFSDVLEHLQRPERVLEKAPLLIKDDGKTLISLPNVAYYSNRLALFSGRWEYRDEGILDRTHLRFFTMLTGRELLETNGYFVREMVAELPVISSQWKRLIFSFVCQIWPSLFAIGWVIEAFPKNNNP